MCHCRPIRTTFYIVNSAWLGGSRIFQGVSTPPMGWLDKPLVNYCPSLGTSVLYVNKQGCRNNIDKILLAYSWYSWTIIMKLDQPQPGFANRSVTPVERRLPRLRVTRPCDAAAVTPREPQSREARVRLALLTCLF